MIYCDNVLVILLRGWREPGRGTGPVHEAVSTHGTGVTPSQPDTLLCLWPKLWGCLRRLPGSCLSPGISPLNDRDSFHLVPIIVLRLSCFDTRFLADSKSAYFQNPIPRLYILGQPDFLKILRLTFFSFYSSILKKGTHQNDPGMFFTQVPRALKIGVLGV